MQQTYHHNSPGLLRCWLQVEHMNSFSVTGAGEVRGVHAECQRVNHGTAACSTALFIIYELNQSINQSIRDF